MFPVYIEKSQKIYISTFFLSETKHKSRTNVSIFKSNKVQSIEKPYNIGKKDNL